VLLSDARTLAAVEPRYVLAMSGARRALRPTVGLVVALTVGLTVGWASTATAAAPPPTVTPSPTITFYFGLKRPEALARTAFFAVQQPGSSSYRRFLSLGQVAARYGASRATRTAFMRAVNEHGLSARIDPSGVFARVSGTVSRFDDVFGVDVRHQFSNAPNADTYFLLGSGRLHLPADMRSLVQDIVPTYAHSATPSGAPTQTASLARAKGPRRSGTWTRGCAKAKATGAFSFGQLRSAYGIDRLGSGNGASVAILNLGEGASRQDIADNAGCFGYPKLRARTLLSDGQTEPFGQGTFEPEEDLALVRGIVPGLTSLTFSQAWLAPEIWFLGASQVLDAPHLPDSFSMSYGECERTIRGTGSTPTSRAGANLMDSVLVRLGLVGVGSYASAGDFGSTCNGLPFPGVAWPASSPFVTAVGGTQLTLRRDNERRNEVVWNDLRYVSATDGGGAGGGGFSLASPRPPFQAGLGLPGNARTTPDVSAAASQFPGWPVVLGGNWVTDAGTSSSAPLVASAMAIISANQRHRHRSPVGPANGVLYYEASRAPTTLFDVISGANGYLAKVPARHAKRGYDLASGLGVPQFALLAAELPPPARLTPPRPKPPRPKAPLTPGG
jgi:subtilase family serine protease